MEKEYIITIFSENKVGLLNQVTTIFTCRNINIESVTASESAISGIHRYTIVVHTDQEKIEKVVKQIEKKVDVIKAYVYTLDQVVQQEIAMYRVRRSPSIEHIVRKFNVRVLEVGEDYMVLEKTGHASETRELFERLKPYGLLQFVRSGVVSLPKSDAEREDLHHYLSIHDPEYGKY